MPLVQVNGIDLYYERLGDGPPVVVVPGLGADSRQFMPFATDLASGGFSALVLDPRGAGRSSKPHQPYSVEQMADDVSGLVSALGIAPVVLVGYSLGGRIAMCLAARHPEQVNRLVLAATSAHDRKPCILGARWLVFNLLARLPKPRPLDSQPSYAFENQRRAAAAFDGRPLLATIRMPTLVVRATRDRIVPRVVSGGLAEIPGARVAELPGGHLSLVLARHRELAAAITGFLSETAS